jgi:hypothetical protein
VDFPNPRIVFIANSRPISLLIEAKPRAIDSGFVYTIAIGWTAFN